MTRPSRRGLLAAVGGAAAVAPLPTLAASPDAALLTLCTRVVAVHASMVEGFKVCPELNCEQAVQREAIADALHDEHAALVERAAGIPAATMAGARAKAAAAHVSAEHDRAGRIDLENQPRFVNDLAWSALADLIRLEGVA